VQVSDPEGLEEEEVEEDRFGVVEEEADAGSALPLESPNERRFLMFEDMCYNMMA
jgi:hypothetical protein